MIFYKKYDKVSHDRPTGDGNGIEQAKRVHNHYLLNLKKLCQSDLVLVEIRD